MSSAHKLTAVGCLAFAAACGGGGSETKSAQAGAVSSSTDKNAAAKSKQDEANTKLASLSDALDRLGEGKPVDAGWLEQQLQQVLAIDSSNRSARYNLAVVKEARGDATGAKATYQELYKQFPDYAPAAENVAADMVAAGDVQKASEIYKSIAAKDPKDTTSRLALARIALRDQRYDEAIELCRQSLQREAQSVEAFRILAESYRLQGNLPMAELVTARGLKVDKDDVQLHYTLAQILFQKNDLPGGVNQLKLAVAADPNLTKVRGQLADIALQYRDYGNASQNFEAIVKQQPQNNAAKIGLAVSYKGLGRYDQSEKLYKEVLTSDVNNVDANWDLAVLYHRNLNRYDDAITYYKKARGLAVPGDQEIMKAEDFIAEAEKQKGDQFAMKAREEAEKKKKDAIDSVCIAVAAKKKPDFSNFVDEGERIEAAWGLMVQAQGVVQQAANDGDLSKVDGAEQTVACAYAMVPESPKASTEACAPMRIMWTQIQYQLGRNQDAMKTIKEARKCDPENPDAKLIEQQLGELLGQAPSASN
ncbi:MAG: tetratricopeptide repeat protein [Clostridia bacterium]|nr:tetratricopeptide repeat protein [Deltaproteobacteria bacterium]